jgi:hypothetical protein
MNPAYNLICSTNIKIYLFMHNLHVIQFIPWILDLFVNGDPRIT